MSFSGMVKEELSKQISPARHCRIAELAALLCACGRLEGAFGEKKLRVQTENEAVVRKCFTLLQKTFNIRTEMQIRESSHMKRIRVFVLELTDQEQVRDVLQGTKLTVDEDAGGTLTLDNLLVIQQNCCKRAFIRGAFLSSGSISDPEKGYHFEIVCPEEGRAKQLQTITRSFDIDAKIVQRKNRKVNCETANSNKTVNAAVKQMEDIKLIQKYIGFEQLNEGLAQLAQLRLQYPEATLKELGMMLNPQVGKSGVNHRLRKLSVMAEELREKQGGELL